ncbi:hypothetical protein BCR33DRAFT_832385 [Rhizoclosmatium globosum]|uniref:Mitochondrial carrier n=1 Tax=Rhizoclosmatium globosum TaxID=329046 RepID=A0A1Y2BTP4_9FUNG|nr:hypothetical protein BCR33DRAFT_832385 [Rhizoclosmatium globosum]|eukprot:ORY38119.1 hypothetical protein BCR33DRAFT_832385 [Rhizoclosmatium globosum]
MQAPSTVLYYFGYEEMRKSIAPRFGEDSIYTPMLAGSAARTLATTVVSPLELVRTRMQAGAGAEGSLRTVIGELRGMIAPLGMVQCGVGWLRHCGVMFRFLQSIGSHMKVSGSR